MDINRTIYSAKEPRQRDALWLRPMGNGVCLYICDGGWRPLRIVNDNNTLTVRDDTVIDVEHIDEKTDTILSNMYYKDLYIGIGSELQDILTISNHFSVLKKGTKFSYSTEGKIYLALSSNSTPTILMNSIQVPLIQEEDAVIEGKVYHIWHSEGTYLENISIVLV